MGSPPARGRRLPPAVVRAGPHHGARPATTAATRPPSFGRAVCSSLPGQKPFWAGKRHRMVHTHIKTPYKPSTIVLNLQNHLLWIALMSQDRSTESLALYLAPKPFGLHQFGSSVSTWLAKGRKVIFRARLFALDGECRVECAWRASRTASPSGRPDPARTAPGTSTCWTYPRAATSFPAGRSTVHIVPNTKE